MKRTESDNCYAACELLLLNGAPTNAIREHCANRFGLTPGVGTVKKWRLAIGVPSRVEPKAFPQRRPADYFTPQERESLELHKKMNSLLAGSKLEERRAA